MIFSYNWLQDYISKKLPAPKKLAEVLTMHSFEVESVVKKDKDFVLDIDVLPNRAPDCFSHLGIAREIAVMTNSKLTEGHPGHFVAAQHRLREGSRARSFGLRPQDDYRTKDFIEVEVKNKEDCPRYTAKVIFDVKVGPSPKWVQERLKVCGLRPINNIVDIANYVMLETGQPIHAFDLDKVTAKGCHPERSEGSRGLRANSETLRLMPQGDHAEIIVRRAKKGEKIITLDNEKYDLDKDILVIADSKEPLCIAGIKGGKKAEIDSKTKNIIIEAANFNPLVTRKASRKLKLKTDASWRFENGIDPDLIDFVYPVKNKIFNGVQDRACSLIQEIASGRVAAGLVDFYPNKVLPKKIRLDLNYVEKLLGIKIPKNKIKNILQSLGFKCNEVRPRYIRVEVPTRRTDISIPEDLIEEIGRIYGFQNIPSIFPQTALIAPERNEELLWQRNIKDTLKEAGFAEVYNYSFIGEKEKSIFGWTDKELAELENPMSSFNKYLRPSLIPNLVKNVKENLKYFEEIKIFEIGKIFRKFQVPSSKFQERQMLSGVLTRKGMKDEGFYELKGVIDCLLNKLGISNIWYDDYQPTPEESKMEIWHPRKRAEIKTNGEEIGFLGEIHPKILEGLEIGERVFLFDLDFEKLIKLASEEHEYQPISAYPAAVRDLAILVPQGTRVAEILNKIDGELVRDVDLFDVYSGEGIPEGKENFAFHIIYQAEDRTLSSQEIDKAHQNIIKDLEENPEWEVRKA